ncbi:MAG: dihydroorotase [Bacteroides sp. SM23_62_1]|nr:MAG: dihydroorotase [Bacteroides sp. SM23_62_1]
MLRLILSFLVPFFIAYFVQAQEYDLVIKQGHLIDPKNEINEIMDIAIADGKVAKVSSSLTDYKAKMVIEAKGMYVIPGIIDIHTHTFFGTEPDAYISNSYTSVPPDGFTLRTGVTTVVDAGSSGWRNFNVFKEQTIDRSETRVLAFLNIVGFGMKGGQVEQNLSDMDAELTAYMANKYPEYIVGIKVAHYSGPEWDPVDRAIRVGNIAGVPVMIDFGEHTPPLSLETLLLKKLRPGDIFTHAYAHVNGRMPVVDEYGKVRDYVLQAQAKGIVFDVGHGGGSFLFEQAIPSLNQGFKPNSISTDLHTGSMNGGMKDILNVSSKFLNLGMTLQEVVECLTWKPARIINREELGHLSEGVIADLAILKMETGDFGFVDTGGWKIKGTQKLICELTIKNGEVVWDLNGITKPEWKNSFQNK